MTRPSIPASRMGRLQFVAEALGVPMAEGLAPDLLGEDGAPAAEVLRFCARHGASLDFIYQADVAILVRYASQAIQAKGEAA